MKTKYSRFPPRHVAVQQAIQKSTNVSDKEAAIQKFKELSAGKSITDSRVIAKDVVGEDVFWDWDRAFGLLCSNRPCPLMRSLPPQSPELAKATTITTAVLKRRSTASTPTLRMPICCGWRPRSRILSRLELSLVGLGRSIPESKSHQSNKALALLLTLALYQ